jgi:hypothetical protein
VVSTFAALLATAPIRFRSLKSDAFYRVLRDKWDEPPRSARRRVAVTRLVLFTSYKRANSLKGWILLGALGAEFVAVSLVAVAVAVIVAQ